MAPSSVVVQSVWASNLHREFIRICQALEVGYTQATLDAEFYLGPSCSKITTHPRFLSPEKRYDDIRTRVDGGRGIRQLGLTLSPSIHGEDGSLDLVWEFNFGPNRKKGQGYGEVPIDYDFFSFLLHSSGLLCNPDITWVFFHSAYDIAFFIKLATFSSPLPLSLPEFSSTVDALLGGRHHIFDIKFIMRFTNDLFGGLAAVSTALGVKRLSGQAHEAGSDSLLTWHVYKRMIHVYFPIGNATRHAGLLYGGFYYYCLCLHVGRVSYYSLSCSLQVCEDIFIFASLNLISLMRSLMYSVDSYRLGGCKSLLARRGTSFDAPAQLSPYRPVPKGTHAASVGLCCCRSSPDNVELWCNVNC